MMKQNALETTLARVLAGASPEVAHRIEQALSMPVPRPMGQPLARHFGTNRPLTKRQRGIKYRANQ